MWFCVYNHILYHINLLSPYHHITYHHVLPSIPIHNSSQRNCSEPLYPVYPFVLQGLELLLNFLHQALSCGVVSPHESHPTPVSINQQLDQKPSQLERSNFCWSFPKLSQQKTSSFWFILGQRQWDDNYNKVPMKRWSSIDKSSVCL